ncbi:MAG: AraC family transcriptional regulator [Candidatus Dactylopiibacterium carminicum]|uniref:AraC family transcriptional regulator n=1 Tax=Candidatus Dactylopiibacterium carminicum TaxID=857335 RepID=A0A272ERP9_9RHOO|nr:AraC family transcriptional regulator [Candidatus Dactylopiibacterium carminicum]KAF7598859.1 AraC family transcriptional regulator [Candidatus Dactylopiibacterium carminicum]PAS92775.1 MAG: AraC family transcriptional regulator [Candidatus Dactylopiibacterium carminicum]PAS96225.1 MAG: AraC family transcriptional regulator [Candidatus Dactylopiibacterium carminicum]PAS98876.1 MAG: AraC family transcriptional regulator [Candidatus Dactylopiibacterium carminicum]
MPAPGNAPAIIDSSLDAARQALVDLLDRLTQGIEGSTGTAISGLVIHRILKPYSPHHSVQTPAFGLIAQGSKTVLMGEQTYTYDALNYLLTSVDVPVCGKISAASPQKPYLGLRLDLELDVIAGLIHEMDEADRSVDERSEICRAVNVHRLDRPLLDAVQRLLHLLDTPADIPVLAPMIKREIFYRLLGSSHRLRQIALHDSQTQRIAKAIRLLREQYDQPLSIEAIARGVHMSSSSLHHHFKAITSMSPLQFQKQLRLQEARRLLFVDDLDIALAARRVGYESASQFSREYSRFCGNAPSRDKRRWLGEEERV